MKKMLLVVLCIFFIAGIAFAGGSKPKAMEGEMHLVVATDATWPPMEYVDESTRTSLASTSIS